MRPATSPAAGDMQIINSFKGRAFCMFDEARILLYVLGSVDRTKIGEASDHVI